jgi:hypothetical protein
MEVLEVGSIVLAAPTANVLELIGEGLTGAECRLRPQAISSDVDLDIKDQKPISDPAVRV